MAVQGANLDSNVIDTFLGGSDFAYFGFARCHWQCHHLQQVQVVSFNGTLQPDNSGGGNVPPPPATDTIASMGGLVTFLGDATYDAASDVVTLTKDESGQQGGDILQSADRSAWRL